MILYCVKEKKQTESVPGSEGYERTKDGRLMLNSECSCGATKTKFVKQKGTGLTEDLIKFGSQALWNSSKLAANYADFAKQRAKSYVNQSTSQIIDQEKLEERLGSEDLKITIQYNTILFIVTYA